MPWAQKLSEKKNESNDPPVLPKPPKMHWAIASFVGYAINESH